MDLRSPSGSLNCFMPSRAMAVNRGGMLGTSMPGESLPAPAATTEQSIGIAVVGMVTAIATKLIGSVLDRWVILGVLLILCAGHLGELYLNLGTTRRPVMLSSIGDVASTIVDSAPASLGGWITAGLVALFAIAIIRVQHRRIKEQGTELADCRKEIDPNRADSRDPEALRRHASMSETETRELLGEEVEDGG